MQKVTPCLWFDNNVEEAINFTISPYFPMTSTTCIPQMSTKTLIPQGVRVTKCVQKW
jgi:predicted 3-demethylubiquinone-9 3-methyltransferase (glyoxalase superfamily)